MFIGTISWAGRIRPFGWLALLLALLTLAACAPTQSASPASAPTQPTAAAPGAVGKPAPQSAATSQAAPAAAPAPNAASAKDAAGGRPLRVVTSIDVLADMIRQVGGERVTVSSFVPAGTDVHAFQPTPQDVQAISGAEIVLLNGAGLEAAAERVVESNLGPNARLVELFPAAVPEAHRVDGHEEHEGEIARPGAAQPEAKAAQPEAKEGVGHAAADGHTEVGVNPHAWLDPQLGVRYVEAIRDALIQADPVGRAVYEANAQRYTAQIQALDQEIAQMIETIPASNRKLVTFHEAFPYLARRYGLEVVGVVVESPEQEPSAAEVAELVRTIKAQGVPAVFSEPQVNARILELVARDAGVRVLPLYSDALDPRVGSYLDLLRFDAEQLVQGLR